MHRCTHSAAGGTIQRLKPGLGDRVDRDREIDKAPIPFPPYSRPCRACLPSAIPSSAHDGACSSRIAAPHNFRHAPGSRSAFENFNPDATGYARCAAPARSLKVAAARNACPAQTQLDLRIPCGENDWDRSRAGVDRQKVAIINIKPTDAALWHDIDGRFAFSIRNTIRLFGAFGDLDLVAGFPDQVREYRSPTADRCSELPEQSPGVSDFSAFRVFSAGNGHFSPVRSSFVVAMAANMAKRAPHRQRCRARPRAFRSGSHSRESRRVWPGSTRVIVLAEFDQSIGLDQRRQQARALAREFDRFERAVLGLAQA